MPFRGTGHKRPERRKEVCGVVTELTGQPNSQSTMPFSFDWIGSTGEFVTGLFGVAGVISEAIRRVGWSAEQEATEVASKPSSGFVDHVPMWLKKFLGCAGRRDGCLKPLSTAWQRVSRPEFARSTFGPLRKVAAPKAARN